jgi:allantoate deiminase
MTLGEIAQTRLSEIAACSVPSAGVTRLPFTPEHRLALNHIRHWMTAAGLRVHMDAAATLVGRLEGPVGSKTLLIGSHQDSVPNGGRYDGIMGVLLPCLALEALQSDGVTLPFSVEILAFADEEGVRFPTALLGPRALAGTFDSNTLDLTDQDGVTLRAALTEFGANPTQLERLARNPADILGYLETHIEQGPVLETHDAPLGVVTGICGIERNSLRFVGQTGHAGTVPMPDRRDALVAASRLIAAVADTAKATNTVRATVGAISVHPNAVNAIPETADFPLEVRSTSDEARQDFTDQMCSLGAQIARENNLAFEMEQTYVQTAVACDTGLSETLSNAVQNEGHQLITLPSGATHDASAMSDLCPIAMLFVRCKNGLSHRPDEQASAEDMNAAVGTISGFLVSLAAAGST